MSQLYLINVIRPEARYRVVKIDHDNVEFVLQRVTESDDRPEFRVPVDKARLKQLGYKLVKEEE
jgi:hypothetical protein